MPSNEVKPLNPSTFDKKTLTLNCSNPVGMGKNGTMVYTLEGKKIFKKRRDSVILQQGIVGQKGTVWSNFMSNWNGVELFYYYLLEEMGFGPKVNAARDKNNKRYILTDGVPNFLSVWDILSTPEMKKLKFDLNPVEKNNMLSKLVELELLVRLMKLSDITLNPDNTGFEVRNNKLVRPVIIDFQTSPNICNDYPFGILLTSKCKTHYRKEYAILPLFLSCGLEGENLKPLQEKALKEMFSVQEGKEVSKFTEAILKAKAKTLCVEPTKKSQRGVNMVIESFLPRKYSNFDIIEHVAKKINPNIMKEIENVKQSNSGINVDIFNVSPSSSPLPSRRGSFSEEARPTETEIITFKDKFANMIRRVCCLG